MDLRGFRASLDAWLDEEAGALTPDPAGRESLEGQMAHLSEVKRRTYDAGWMLNRIADVKSSAGQ